MLKAGSNDSPGAARATDWLAAHCERSQCPSSSTRGDNFGSLTIDTVNVHTLNVHTFAGPRVPDSQSAGTVRRRSANQGEDVSDGSAQQFAVGVDFGTLSARAVVVDVTDGAVSGARWPSTATG